MRNKQTKKCVLNFTDGREAWQDTIGAFVLSKKGIVASVLLSILTMGSGPFWWPVALKNGTIDVYKLLLALSCILILSVLGGLVYLRKRTERSLDVKYILHQFVHDIRDYHSKLFRHLKEINKKKNRDFAQEYKEHLLLLANHIRDLFRKLVNDTSVEVVIRLAYPSKDQNGNVVYVTRVRTFGLNKNRELTTQPIPANKGLPRYLIEKDCHEILIYEDIEEASILGLFEKTKSEEKFPNEIKTMMVSPLNAFDGSKRSMIGILYITSRNDNVFKEKHIDSARFVADASANSISFGTMMYKLIGSYSKRGSSNVRLYT